MDGSTQVGDSHVFGGPQQLSIKWEAPMRLKVLTGSGDEVPGSG